MSSDPHGTAVSASVPGPASVSLDGLVPQAGPDFVPAFLLAATRRNGRAWLGRTRSALLAAALGLDETKAIDLLDLIPRPPSALGDPATWFGRRVPLLIRRRIAWAELFWRPDRRAGARRNDAPIPDPRGHGGFAMRLQLPHAGPVEFRGRIEETRLDMVMQVGCLTREAAFDATTAFCETLERLGFRGELSIRADSPDLILPAVPTGRV